MKPKHILSRLQQDESLHLVQLILLVVIVIDYSFAFNIRQDFGNLFYILPAILLVPTLFMPIRDYTSARTKRLILVLHHTAAAVFLIFFTDIFGPYFQILILLLFAAAFWYGLKGLVWSLTAQLAIITAAVFYQFDGFSQDLFYKELIYFVTLIIVGTLFERITASYRKEEQRMESLNDTVYFERTRLISLINSMADAVIATDKHGTILLYNGAALDLLNTNMSLDNKNLRNFLDFHNQNDKRVDIITEATESSSTIKRDDLSFKANDGQEVDVYLSVSPIIPGFTSRGGEGFIMILRDITKEKTLDEQRDEFISVASHELRTPIAIAEANISTALLPALGEMPPAAKQLLEQAHQNVVFLADLVNDLTTLGRTERGDLKIEIEDVIAHEILKEVSKSIERQAKEKKLKVKLKVSKKLPILKSNNYRVQEILQNFATNALKYTEKGSITLSARAEDGGITFDVADTGIGISNTDKKHMFSKFYRSEDYRTRKTSGTGLGLYISKKLADRLGGRVWFESRLNKGSTFYLWLPLAVVVSK